MGCDIHFFVEVRKDGEWTLAPGQLRVCERCEGSGKDPVSSRCANCKKTIDAHMPDTNKCLYNASTLEELPEPCEYHCIDGKSLYPTYYSGRNYDLFGILSGVRGDIDEKFTREDRGWPDDTSYYVSKYGDNQDLHSHGYYTLTELLERDWSGVDFRMFKKALTQLAALDKDSDNVRAVFCYDN